MALGRGERVEARPVRAPEHERRLALVVPVNEHVGRAVLVEVSDQPAGRVESPGPDVGLVRVAEMRGRAEVVEKHLRHHCHGGVEIAPEENQVQARVRVPVRGGAAAVARTRMNDVPPAFGKACIAAVVHVGAEPVIVDVAGDIQPAVAIEVRHGRPVRLAVGNRQPGDVAGAAARPPVDNRVRVPVPAHGHDVHPPVSIKIGDPQVVADAAAQRDDRRIRT